MINEIKNIRKYFWRGLYRTVIDIESVFHKVDLWLYNKVDYPFFVKGDVNNLIGISRQPFRVRA